MYMFTVLAKEIKKDATKILTEDEKINLAMSYIESKIRYAASKSEFSTEVAMSKNTDCDRLRYNPQIIEQLKKNGFECHLLENKASVFILIKWEE